MEVRKNPPPGTGDAAKQANSQANSNWLGYWLVRYWLGLAILACLAIELAVDLAMAWLLSAIVWLLDPGGPDVYSEAP